MNQWNVLNLKKKIFWRKLSAHLSSIRPSILRVGVGAYSELGWGPLKPVPEATGTKWETTQDGAATHSRAHTLSGVSTQHVLDRGGGEPEYPWQHEENIQTPHTLTPGGDLIPSPRSGRHPYCTTLLPTAAYLHKLIYWLHKQITD